MRRLRGSAAGRAWVGAALLVGMIGCKQDDKQDDSSAPVASVTEPVQDTKIAKAVKEVTAAPNAPLGQQGGPPPNGVLSPEQAAEELASGAVAVLSLGDSGQAPKVRLVPSPLSGSAQLEISVRQGQAVMPTAVLGVKLSRSQPKATGDGAEGQAQPGRLEVEIVKTGLSSRQPGQLPPGADKTVSTLKGTRLSAASEPTGAHADFQLTLGKQTDPQLAPMARGAQELLHNVTVPFPAEPVGQGAFWMVTSRESYGGLEVMAYRLVRVETIKGDEVKLSVSLKRYLIGDQVRREGLPRHQVMKFQGTGEGELLLDGGSGRLRQARFRQSTMGLLALQGRKGQPGQDQFAVEGAFQSAPSPAARRPQPAGAQSAPP